ncbi:hypothetical protein D3C73_1591700 [compost metagenome]
MITDRGKLLILSAPVCQEGEKRAVGEIQYPLAGLSISKRIQLLLNVGVTLLGEFSDHPEGFGMRGIG